MIYNDVDFPGLNPFTTFFFFFFFFLKNTLNWHSWSSQGGVSEVQFILGFILLNQTALSTFLLFEITFLRVEMKMIFDKDTSVSKGQDHIVQFH